MGTRTMSEETKAKIAATRAAKKEGQVPGEKRATLDEQIAAYQAQADAGDTSAVTLMPIIDVYREKLAQAKADAKTAARKLRKLLSV